MKIGIVFHAHPAESIWSHTRFLRAVGRVLVAEGDEVVAFYPTPDGRPHGAPSWEGIQAAPVRSWSSGGRTRLPSWEVPLRVRGELDRSFDVIISTADSGAGWLFDRARRLGILGVDWFQGVGPRFLSFGERTRPRDQLGLGFERWIIPWFEKRNVHKADLILACSSMNRRDLQALYGIPEEKIAVLPNGFDPVPPITPEERRQARSDLGLPEGTFYASFVGVDWKRKGLDVLRDSVHLARARGAPWRVLQAGSSKGTTEEEIGFGFIDGKEKRRMLAASDAFVFPTRYEGSPLPIPEAAALGLPIVTTPDVSVDLGTRGRDLLEVPTGDAKALADVLVELAHDPGRMRRVGESGHAAFAQWTWEAQAHELRRVLTKALERVRGPTRARGREGVAP